MAGPSSSASFRLFSKSQAKMFALGDKEKALGPIDTRMIFNEMKSVVWVIAVTNLQKADEDNTRPTVATGFCIHPDGYIFTVANVFRENFTEIKIRKIDDTEFRLSKNGHVRLVKKYNSYNIALLKAEICEKDDADGFNYATFGESKLFVGQEVISIGHQNRLVYTTARGEIEYPCVNNIVLEKNSKAIKDEKYLKTALLFTPAYREAIDIIKRNADDGLNLLGTDVPLIQINNLHNSRESLGCPIFNSNGLVVGMLIFIGKTREFALHVSCLKEFYNTYVMEDREKLKAKRSDKKKGKKRHRKTYQ